MPQSSSPNLECPFEAQLESVGSKMSNDRYAAYIDVLLERRAVLLQGELNDASCKTLIAQMLFLQHEDARRPIHLYITSPGGGVAHAFAVLETIDRITPPTFTYCYGLAGGSAATIVAHGARLHRFAGTNAQFSLCKPWASDSVSPTELSSTTLQLAEQMAADTGRSVEEVSCKLEDNAVLDAPAARAFGLVDHVVVNYEKSSIRSLSPMGRKPS